jgi:hypothetical protein
MLKLKTLSDLLTVTRASEAALTDADGNRVFAAANVLRRDHHPVTGAVLGALVEPARDNLLLQSAAFDEAVWVKTGGTVAQSDGVWVFDEDTSSGAHGLSQTIAFTAAQAYVLWAEVRPEGHDIRLSLPVAAFSGAAEITLSEAGAVSVSGAQTGLDGGAIDLGGGVWRVWVTAQADASVSGAVAANLISGGAASYAGAFGRFGILRAQVEPGTWPGSAIRTTDTAATRAADVVTAAADWIRPGSGTLWIEASARFSGSAAFRPLWTLDDGTADNAISLGVQSGLLRVQVAKAGVSVLDQEVGAVAEGDDIRVAIAWGADGLRHARLGTAAIVAGVPVPFGLSTLRIAADSAGQADLALWLKRIVYWPSSVDTAGLANLTAPPDSAPELAAADALSGRDLTITASSVTGWPVPAVSLDLLTLDGVDVSGDATGSGPWTYTVPDSATARTVAWRVKATNARGTATVSGSEAVAANLFAPAISGQPTITGDLVENQTITAVAAPVTGTPAPVRSWKWFVGGVEVLGETGNTLVLDTGDIGETVTVQQIETNSVGTATATSNGYGPVQEAPFDPATLFITEPGAFWNLTQMSGLHTDLDGTVAVTAFNDPIRSANDLSGNGNRINSQLTAAAPTYVENGGLPGAYYANAAAERLVRNASVIGVPNWASPTDEITVMVVAQANSQAGTLIWSDGSIGGTNDYIYVLGELSSNSIRAQATTGELTVNNSTAAQTYGTPHVILMEKVGGVGRHYLDGVLQETDPPSGSFGTWAMTLNGGIDLRANDAIVFTALVIGRALTTDERNSLTNWGKALAGIA